MVIPHSIKIEIFVAATKPLPRMTDITQQIFCEGRTQVTSHDVADLKDIYRGLDKSLFGLRLGTGKATIYVHMEHLDRFPDVCRRVRKHMARFPGN